MAQETVRERLAPRVCWRVASAYELDTLKLHPNAVVRTPEASLLCKLAQVSDNCYGAVLVLVREVYFVAEHNKPDTRRLRT